MSSYTDLLSNYSRKHNLIYEYNALKRQYGDLAEATRAAEAQSTRVAAEKVAAEKAAAEAEEARIVLVEEQRMVVEKYTELRHRYDALMSENISLRENIAVVHRYLDQLDQGMLYGSAPAPRNQELSDLISMLKEGDEQSNAWKTRQKQSKTMTQAEIIRALKNARGGGYKTNRRKTKRRKTKRRKTKRRKLSRRRR